MSFYAEYNALQALLEKERKQGLTKKERILEDDLREELYF